MVNTAVLAPMPSARVSTATAAKPGAPTRPRTAYRMSPSSVLMGPSPVGWLGAVLRRVEGNLQSAQADPSACRRYHRRA
jgi:hypothetical protein